ncbi:MAG: helix-turn-helix domain-containing protein [Candidatus Nanosalina sp.]
MSKIFRNGDPPETVESEELDEQKIKALSDGTRWKILEIVARHPSYPLEVARELGIEKQKAYYHFEKLQEADLIEEDHKENVSGGSATFYRASAPGYILDLGTPGEELHTLSDNEEAQKFLDPMVSEGKIEGKIVVGSPEEHGPDRVQARDGHLAGEIGAKLGNYGKKNSRLVKLDTEVHRDSSFEENMVMIGGVLTNTVTKKFNEEFPVSFEGDEFPYREISTPESSYSEGMIGVVAKTENPENPENSIFMVAGVQNSGTEAAVLAFKNLEDIVENYEEGDFYQVVRGLDLDGDGEVDDFEVVE